MTEEDTGYKVGKCPHCGEPDAPLWKIKDEWWCVDCGVESDKVPDGYFKRDTDA